MLYLQTEAGILYCGSDGGVFKSSDQAENWTDISATLVNTQFYRIAGTDASTNLVLGGTQDQGSNVWTDSAFTHIWGADGFECAIDPNNSNIVYFESQYGNLKRSTDQGNTNTEIRPSGESGSWLTPFHLHPQNSTTIFAGWSEVYRSTDSGTSWASLNSGIPNNLDAMAQGINNTGRFYASDGTTLLMSNNINADPASVSWTDVTAGIPAAVGSSITYIAVNPDTSSEVFVTLSGYQDGNKVFYSNNAGSSWTNISGSLPNLPVNCIAYETGSADGIYVGIDVGVFYRDNNIGDWIPFMNGLPNVIVTELEIRNNSITAGTYGRGLWRSDTYSHCPVSHNLTPQNDPSNPNYTGFQHYEAEEEIQSTRIITGGEGTGVTYKAGDRVILLEGFRAKEGTRFNAALGPCSGVMKSKEVKPLKGKFDGSLGIFVTKND